MMNQNRLKMVSNGSFDWSRYHYDAFGRRIARTVGSTRTYGLYDGWNPIAEFTGAVHTSGSAPAVTLERTWLWGTDLSGTLQGAGGVGGLLAVNLETGADAGVYHPLYDGNGNIGQYVNSSGNAVAKYEYDGFGNSLVSAGTHEALFPHRFSTKPLNSETGLYYYGFRDYDAATGRWPSRDPIGEEGGENLYGFVYNVPIGWIDLFGLKAQVKCTRYKTSGIMRCKTIENGKTSDTFTTNDGQDKDGNDNKNTGQVPEGTYNLKPKPQGQMNKGNENLKAPDNWNGYAVTGPGGSEFPVGTPSLTGQGKAYEPGHLPGYRDEFSNVRVHGKGLSSGCTATDRANEIRKMMDRNPGETTETIKDVGCICKDGKQVPASDP